MHAHCTTTGAVDGEPTLQIEDYALYSAAPKVVATPFP
jgi:hypothetical protein